MSKIIKRIIRTGKEQTAIVTFSNVYNTTSSELAFKFCISSHRIAHGGFLLRVIAYRPARRWRTVLAKGRIWFINMMNDYESKVSRDESSLRSNIPWSMGGRGGLRILWRIQIVTLRSYSVPGKPFSCAFHVQWKMKPDPVFLWACRSPLQDLSRISPSPNGDSQASLPPRPCDTVRNFCRGKRISRNLICPLTELPAPDLHWV